MTWWVRGIRPYGVGVEHKPENIEGDNMGNRVRMKGLKKRLTSGEKRRRLARIERRAAANKEAQAGLLKKLGIDKE